MKPLLALATLALVMLIAERGSQESLAKRGTPLARWWASDATESIIGSIKARPLVALLIAGAVGYVAARSQIRAAAG